MEADLGYTVNSSPTWATETQSEKKNEEKGQEREERRKEIKKGRGGKGGRRKE